MIIDFLLEQFASHADDEAVVWRGRSFSFRWLNEQVADCRQRLIAGGVGPGQVVVLDADFSPAAIALLLALIEQRAIAVPLTSAAAAQRDEFMAIAEAEALVRIRDNEVGAIEPLGRRAAHPLYEQLRGNQRPGLVVFSSGSTGKSKGIVHDFVPLLDKFRRRRERLRIIAFLLFDHLGGINTLFYSLSNAGCLITLEERTTSAVLGAIAAHRAELLPATPTFLNLMLVSEADREYDLSSLRLITYGTEPMPEATLKLLNERLPGVRITQTYGLSEIGVLRSKSRDSSSLWVKLGGEGFETRVVDGILHIRGASAMLGYLNAESPFTADGWLNTNDRVEVDGEYFRILGRDSDIINVGGQKVYPAEVESVIQGLDNIAEVTVFGEKHALTGHIVCARVTVKQEVDVDVLRREIRRACRERLESYKVPVKIEVTSQAQHGERFKKIRRPAGAGASTAKAQEPPA